MWKYLESKLFRLLSDASQVTNEEMQTAYGCFMEQLRTVSHPNKIMLIYFGC